MVNRDLGITDYMAGLGRFSYHGIPGGVVASGWIRLLKLTEILLLLLELKATANTFHAMGKALSSVNPVD